MKSELHPVYYYYARHVGHHGRSEYKKPRIPHIHTSTPTQKRNHELFEKVGKKEFKKSQRKRIVVLVTVCMYCNLTQSAKTVAVTINRELVRIGY